MRRRFWGIVLSVICITSMLAQDVQVYASEPILEVAEEAIADEDFAGAGESIGEEESIEADEAIKEVELVEEDEEPIDEEEIIEAEPAESEEPEEIESVIDEEFCECATGQEMPEDAVLDYFESKIFGYEQIESTNYTEQNLNDIEKDLYNKAKEQVTLIAEGESAGTTVIGSSLGEFFGGKTTWSGEELGVGPITDSTDMLVVVEAWMNNVLYPVLSFTKVYYAVLADCPYECYWVGAEYSYGCTGSYSKVWNSSEEVYYIDISNLSAKLIFYASQDYAVATPDGLSYYPAQVDTNKTQAVGAAIENAQAIVTEAAENPSCDSDFDILKYYRNKLCELNSYNYAAAATIGYYGDPWQVIYMFDGDPDTKVVCEGYSKSFKYLCDMTNFASSLIRCYTVSGYMDGGAHMWNNVRMDDGKIYLVDVTNCDQESGVLGSLFVASPISGNIADGYVFNFADQQTISYVYDPADNPGTQSIYTEDVLNYSSTPYSEDGNLEEFTITFNANGGSVSETTRKVVEGQAYGELPVPMRDGYDFAGWYTTGTGGSQVNATTTAMGDAVIYAHWTGKTYTNTLNYDGNGGDVNGTTRKSTTVRFPNTKATFTVSTSTASRTGYTFDGWYTAATGGNKVAVGSSYDVGSDNVAGNQEATLYAHWTANPYTITLIYDANGGSGAPENQTATVIFPDTQSTFTVSTTVPTKTGYSFNGWYTFKTGGSRVSADSQYTVGLAGYTKDYEATLYAHWTADSYTNTLKYDAKGGSGGPTSTTKTVTYPNTKATFTVSTLKPSRAGYTFDGWYTAAIGGDMVEAKSSYDVGSNYQLQNQEATLYAHWTANTYTNTLKYDANGGAFDQGAGLIQQTDVVIFPNTQSTFTVDPGQEPSREGYTFAGWYTSRGGGAKYEVGSSYAVGSDNKSTGQGTTLYAHWTADSYTNTLKYDANGGAFDQGAGLIQQTDVVIFPNTQSTFTVDPGQEPSCDGFVFAGWYTAASGGTKVSTGSSYAVGSQSQASGQEATLYAHWATNMYIISFDACGGSVSEESRTLGEGEAYGELPVPMREGYDFAGWYTEENGGSQVDETTTAVGDAEIYARWTAKSFTNTLKYDANGGTFPQGESLAQQTATVTFPDTQSRFAVGPDQDPSRAGYTFDGWYTTATGGNKVAVGSFYVVGSNNKAEDQEVTLYAHWKAVEKPKPTSKPAEKPKATVYKISFNGNGGSVSGATTKSIEKGKKYGTLPKATRAGYTFGGWYTAKSGGTKVSATTKCTGKKTVYAHWTANKYTVKFNANGGKGSMKKLSVTYGKTKTLSANKFKKKGYKFKGWATSKKDAKKGIVKYKNKKKVKNLTTKNKGTVTLYAVWGK